jgi:hypothetical protein
LYSSVSAVSQAEQYYVSADSLSVPFGHFLSTCFSFAVLRDGPGELLHRYELRGLPPWKNPDLPIEDVWIRMEKGMTVSRPPQRPARERLSLT